MFENNIDLVVIFVAIILLVTTTLCFHSYRKYQKRLRNPKDLLKTIDDILSDNNIPDYFVIPHLRKAIKLHPKNMGLVAKLKNIEKTIKQDSSQEEVFLVLSVSISLLGISLIGMWLYAIMNSYGLFLGILFNIGAVLVFRQYLKEKSAKRTP